MLIAVPLRLRAGPRPASVSPPLELEGEDAAMYNWHPEILQTRAREANAFLEPAIRVCMISSHLNS